MKVGELKAAVSGITIPEARRRRILTDKPTPRRFQLRLVRLVVAGLVVFALLIGIPHLYRNPAGKTELVLGSSPLVLKVAALEEERYKLEDISVWQEIDLGKYVPVMNCVPGFPFHFSAPGMEIMVTVDAGELIYWDIGITYSDGYLVTGGWKTGSGEIDRVGKTYSYQEDGWIYWQPLTEEGLAEAALMEYRLMEGGHIYGYGLIELNAQKNGRYTATLLQSVGFPWVDGKPQGVTEAGLDKIRAKALSQGK